MASALGGQESIDATLSAEFVPPASSYKAMLHEQVVKASRNQPSAFKVRAQLLSSGRTDSVLAASVNLTVRLKVYASGGENALHAHANEDHVFIILSGTADFFDREGLLAQLGGNEGLMLPKGSLYRFNATGDAPLVMLRIGSPNESAQGTEGRLDVAGELAPGDAIANKTVEVQPLGDLYFG